jgi:hypothetical protein
MTGQRTFTGETEFSRIEVEINDDDPEEWPMVEITIQPIDAVDDGHERSVVLAMDEARVLIGGLGFVVR